MHSRCSSCRGMFLRTTLNGETCTFDASVAAPARGTFWQLRRMEKCAQTLLLVLWFDSVYYAEWRSVHIRMLTLPLLARAGHTPEVWTLPPRVLVHGSHLFAVRVLMRCSQRSAHPVEVRMVFRRFLRLFWSSPSVGVPG